MKVTIIPLHKETTFEEFCEDHDLEIVVKERARLTGWRGLPLARWHASVKDLEIKDGAILAGIGGDGDTPKGAIAQLSRKMLGKRLVFGAYRDYRREFNSPHEWSQ